MFKTLKLKIQDLRWEKMLNPILLLLSLIFFITFSPPGGGFAYAGDIEAVLEDASGTSGLSVKDSGNNEVARIDSDGNFQVKAQADVRFADSDSSNYVALQAPATVSSDLTWTLPSADGSNGQVLSTNGSGTLSWSTVTTSAANTALSNLASVAINTSLISDADNTDDLGSLDKAWNNTYSNKIFTTVIAPHADGTTALQINKADGTTNVVNIDTTNSRVGIGLTAPNQQLELTGSLRVPATTSSTTGVIYKGTNSFIHDYTASGKDGLNTFVGINAGNFTMTGSDSWSSSYNTGLGYEALKVLTSGDSNTALGFRTLLANTSGSGNTAVGMNAGLSVNTGASNVMVGVSAGDNITSGSANVIIGVDVEAPSATADNQLSIGNIIFGTGLDGRAKTVSSGNVGIGVVSPTAALHLKAGTATASTAPLKLTAGTNLGTTEAGAIEYDGTHLYFTAADEGTRYQLDQQASSGANTALSNLASVAINTSLISDADNTDDLGSLDKAWNNTYSNKIFTTVIAPHADGTTALQINKADGTTNVVNIDTTNSRVGIGLTAPNQQLELTGSLRVPATTSSTTGVIYKGTNSFIHDYKASGVDGQNTFVGVGSGNFTMSGSNSWEASYNTGLGYNSLNGLTSGYNNTALGQGALYLNAAGNNNTAAGYAAVSANTSGNYNTGFGSTALNYTQTGSGNTAVGYQSGYGVASNSFSNNSLLGYQTGYALTTGSNNIAVGYQAANALTSGSNNIVIGYDIDAQSNTASNQMTIGNIIFATGVDGTGTTVSAGNVGIGVVSPTAKLHLKAGTATAGTAPLKLTAGTNLGTTEAGAIEYDGTHLYFTAADEGTRYQLDQQAASSGANTALSNLASVAINAGLVSDTDSTYDLGTSTVHWKDLYVDRILQSTTGHDLTVEHDGEDKDIIFKVNDGGVDTTVMTIDGATSRVGIGETSPSQQLELSKSLELQATTDSTTGVIYKGADRFIHNFTASGATGGNTFVGVSAGNFTMSFSSGDQTSYNTALGKSALTALTTGYSNTAVGYSALTGVTSAWSNTAVGFEALKTSSTGSYNTAVGYQALNKATNGSNTAVGYSALANTSSGYHNTGMGDAALYNNMGGHYNVGIGNDALRNTGDSLNNTAVGYQAGTGAYGGVFSNNALFGYKAGYALTTGDNNIAVGYQAADGLTSGSNNIVIGYDIDAPSNTASNQLTIGNIIFGTTVDGSGTTVSTGNVGIREASPSYTLHISSAASADTSLALSDGDVAHGVTDTAETDVFGKFAAISSTAGGLDIKALSDTDAQALSITGIIGSTDPTDATPAVRIIGSKKNTTSPQDLASAETVFAVANNDNSDALVVLGDGSVKMVSTGSYELTPSDGIVTINGGITTNSTITFTSLGSGTGTDLVINSSDQVVKSSSSRRYKKDIVPLELDSAKVFNLQPVSFSWKSNGERDFGLIAEDVYKVLPQLVNKNSNDEPESVKYNQISVLLLAEVKKQSEAIKLLMERVEQLSNENKILKAEMGKVQAR